MFVQFTIEPICPKFCRVPLQFYFYHKILSPVLQVPLVLSPQAHRFNSCLRYPFLANQLICYWGKYWPNGYSPNPWRKFRDDTHFVLECSLQRLMCTPTPGSRSIYYTVTSGSWLRHWQWQSGWWLLTCKIHLVVRSLNEKKTILGVPTIQWIIGSSVVFYVLLPACFSVNRQNALIIML